MNNILNIQELILDVSGKTSSRKIIHARKGDKNTRTISISIIDDDEILMIPSDVIIKMRYKHDDENYGAIDCLLMDNKVSVTLTAEILMYKNVLCDIALYEGLIVSDDDFEYNTLLSTECFDIKCD